MMKKTQNTYSPPVKLTERVRVSYKESPAHVGALRHSVDFIVAKGTPVYAAADGVVVDLKQDSSRGGESKEFEPAGNYIEIKHDHDEYSEYEHLRLNGACVAKGETVRRGQVIGYTGATGWLAHLGPHLHFMVGKYGKTVQDYKTLEIVWDRQLP